MHPLVRDLYRRFLWAGRDYPRGLPFVRARAKTAFFRNASLTGEDIFFAVAKGRWWVKEMVGVIQLRKYRAMRSRYGDAASGLQGVLERRLEEEDKEWAPTASSAKAGAAGSVDATLR